MSVVWAALFGGAVWLASRDRAAVLVVAIGVVSHWVLDWVTHPPDMPLYPGGPRLGLGLWDSVGSTIAVETVMFIAGVALYARVTRHGPGGRITKIAFSR